MSTAARLLIVDDSPTALRLLQAIFESQRYEVVTAVDGLDGLEKARQCRPDLVITDSVMPGLDGFGLLRSLREHPATALIPVVMLTSGDPQDAETKDRQPQPDAVVAKSFNMDPLLLEVRNALQRGPRTP